MAVAGWTFMLTGATLALGCLSLRYRDCGPGRPGLKFALFVSATRPRRSFDCKKLDDNSLQLVSAVQWAVDRVNTRVGSHTFFPDANLDFEVFDDCGNQTYAAFHAYNVLGDLEPRLQHNCRLSNSTQYAAIVVASDSSVAKAVVESTRYFPIPVLSPTAASSELIDYPNFVRTTVSDKVQVKAVVSLLQLLGWTYLAAVHTDDEYGSGAMSILKKEADKVGICFDIVEKIPTNIYTDELVRDLIKRIAKTSTKARGGSIGVVYYGQQSAAERIFSLAPTSGVDMSKIHWIVSDAVGGDVKVFSSGNSKFNGLISLSIAGLNLYDFQSYFSDRIEKYEGKNSSSNIDLWIANLYKNTYEHTPPKNLFVHLGYVTAVVDTVYLIAEAKRKQCIKDVRNCYQTSIDSARSFLQEILKTNLSYDRMDHAFVPREFLSTRRSLWIDGHRSVAYSSSAPAIYINQLWEGSFTNVGKFTNGRALYVNKTDLRMLGSQKDIVSGSSLPPSACEKTCDSCIDRLINPVLHVPGDILLLGIFSLHDRGKQFLCGPLRTVSTDSVTAEAFVHAVYEARNRTGLSLGAVLIDDCYNPLQATRLLSEYFSGHTTLRDFQTNANVSLEKVFAILGPLSSGVAKPLAQMFTNLQKPIISYGASSPDLDDRISYPYFLRTVPSDVEQVRAIIGIIKEMKWNYVGFVFVDNNYGQKAKEWFVRNAMADGICVAEPVEMSGLQNASDMDTIVTTLRQQLVKVVIYFGTTTRIGQLLAALERHNMKNEFVFIASETWGKTESVLEDGGGLVVPGSLSLALKSNSADSSFKEYLVRTNFRNTPFAKFWSSRFRCNLKGSFRNIYEAECPDSLRISGAEAREFVSDQRVVHAMNAVYAVAEAIRSATAFCRFSPQFPCSALTTGKFVEILKGIELREGSTKFRVFQADGNGYSGFHIYSIQKKRASREFEYIDVGSYSRGQGLHLKKEFIKFYDKRYQEISRVAGICNSKCDCDLGTTPATRTSQGGRTELGSVKDILSAVLVLVALIFLAIAGLLSLLVIRRCLKKKQVQKMQQNGGILKVKTSGLSPASPGRGTGTSGLSPASPGRGTGTSGLSPASPGGALSTSNLRGESVEFVMSSHPDVHSSDDGYVTTYSLRPTSGISLPNTSSGSHRVIKDYRRTQSEALFPASSAFDNSGFTDVDIVPVSPTSSRATGTYEVVNHCWSDKYSQSSETDPKELINNTGSAGENETQNGELMRSSLPSNVIFC